jgi:hypothetical protein
MAYTSLLYIRDEARVVGIVDGLLLIKWERDADFHEEFYCEPRIAPWLADQLERASVDEGWNFDEVTYDAPPDHLNVSVLGGDRGEPSWVRVHNDRETTAPHGAYEVFRILCETARGLAAELRQVSAPPPHALVERMDTFGPWITRAIELEIRSDAASLGEHVAAQAGVRYLGEGRFEIEGAGPKGLVVEVRPWVTRASEPEIPSEKIPAEKIALEKEKLDVALKEVAEKEGPTFQFHEDPETGRTILRGLSELQLERIVDLLTHEYKVQARVGKPQVEPHETVGRISEAEARVEREASFDWARVRVAPRPRHAGNTFQLELPERSPVSPAIAQAALLGVREAAQRGPSGYPLEDVEVTVLGVEVREGAAPETGAKLAASEAFRRACQEAAPMLLEPIMAVEVRLDKALDAVLGDLKQRGGRIEDVGPHERWPAGRTIKARVPLQHMFGYAADLKSLTDWVEFTMRFAGYEVWI